MKDIVEVVSENIRTEILGKISRRQPFALYMLPGANSVFLDMPQPGSGSAEEPQFVFNGWLGRFHNQRVMRDLLLSPVTYTPTAAQTEAIRHDDYCSRLASLIASLREKGGKAVVSRMICGKETFCPVDILSLAEEYFKANPVAFRCLFCDCDGDIWLTATPELLVDVKYAEEKLSTVALAGTRDVVHADMPWDEKNRCEQRFVTDYILERLRGLGLSPREGDTFTAPSANVCHIKTEITCENVSKDRLPAIVDTLNPTPAVAGYPLEKALTLIESCEIHDRSLYAGYVGISEAGRLRLYVNLRTCRISGHGWAIYVGSGITASSVPEDEWRETALKASCLLGMMNKLNLLSNEPSR